jgi:hypothetical protein
MICSLNFLSLSLSSRLILQTEPAFLIVHINAAFSRLTGIQNSTVVGRPVSKIIAWIEQLQFFPPNPKKSTTSSLQGEPTEPDSPNDSIIPLKVALPGTEEEEVTKSDTSSLSSHENISFATGVRAAKMGEESEVSINHLIALSGFGRYHKVQTLDVRVLPTSASLENRSNHDSIISTISSKNLSNKPTICMMSVCPIMDSSSQHMQLPSTSPSNISSKRKKHAHPAQSRRSHEKDASPSHFIVQFFPLEEDILNPVEVPANTDASASIGSSRRDVTTPGNGEMPPGGSSTSKAVVACG